MKKFGRFLSSGLLKLSLLVLAFSGAAWLTFSTPENIKKAANESNIYSSAVDNILDSAKKDALKGDANLPLDQPEVIAAAKAAFPPELLSSSSETIIDGVYDWLGGKTDKPQFAVDLTDAKQKLAVGLADYAQKRYEALPVCSTTQLRNLSPDVDPYALECKPPTLSSSTVRQQVLDKILLSPDFLKDTTFTADDLPKDEQGRNVTENLEPARNVFQASRLMPWLAGLIALLCAIAVVFWSDTKKQGLKSVGITLVGTGLFIGIGAYLIAWTFDQANKQQGSSFQQSLVSALKSLVGSFNSGLMKFYVSFVAIGAMVLLALWFQNRQNNTISTSKK